MTTQYEIPTRPETSVPANVPTFNECVDAVDHHCRFDCECSPSAPDFTGCTKVFTWACLLCGGVGEAMCCELVEESPAAYGLCFGCAEGKTEEEITEIVSYL